MNQHPSTPAERAHIPSDLAFIKRMRASGSAVIDTVDEHHLETVGTGKHPHGLVVHPTGRWVSVVDAYDDSFTILDTAGRYETGDGLPTVREHVDLPDDSSPSSCFLTERSGPGSYA